MSGGGQVKLREVLARLLDAHEAWYDVRRDYEFAGRTFPGYAEYHAESSQYVLVKRAKLWSAHTHEYLFFVLVDTLDDEILRREYDFMTTQAIGKVDPEPDHMTSYLSLVILAHTVSAPTRRLVAKTRFRKNLKWGLKGWVDLRLAVVDYGSQSVLTNQQGVQMRETLARVCLGEAGIDGGGA